MEEIGDQVIQDDQLRLDGKAFIHCVLERCALEYSGGEVSFERTTLRGCRYVFFGPARATVHFLQTVGIIEDSADWADMSERTN